MFIIFLLLLSSFAYAENTDSVAVPIIDNKALEAAIDELHQLNNKLDPSYVLKGECNTSAATSELSPKEAQAKWKCENDVHPHPNQGLVEEPGTGGCPAGMVRVKTGKDESVKDFCMDRFEASLELVSENKSKTDWSPFHAPGKETVRAVSLRGAMAQQFITGIDARKACERAGKRLCEDSEWLRACRGPNDGFFPYSWPEKKGDAKATDKERYPPGTSKDDPPCHESVPAWAPGLFCQLDPKPICSSSRDGAVNRMMEPCVAQIPFNQAARTGSFPKCVTPDGIFDLVGNVHEWTANTSGIFRGGYFSDTERNGPGCAYATTAHNTGHSDYSTGFRCCADAPKEGPEQ